MREHALATPGGASSYYWAAGRSQSVWWGEECQHQVEPDPAEMAARYGADHFGFDRRGFISRRERVSPF
jgi:hypothetical protein